MRNEALASVDLTAMTDAVNVGTRLMILKSSLFKLGLKFSWERLLRSMCCASSSARRAR